KQISLDKNKLKETGLNAKNTIAVTWESIVNKVEKRYHEIIEEHKKTHVEITVKNKSH
ncbi:MAG: hypothetical protein K0Q49_1148, partial [Haloplasmataceae bacterium]|nr:hypothetical protein [Haloplasmataceae bacterium]